MPTPTVPPARCLCGGVSLKFKDGVHPVVGNCFCTHCSVGAGGPYQVNFTFEESSVTLEDPENLMKAYDINDCESGKPKPKFFCGRCGCTMYTKPEFFPGKIFVKGSLVEGGCKDFKPSVELFTKNRPSFIKPVDGAEQHETQP